MISAYQKRQPQREKSAHLDEHFLAAGLIPNEIPLKIIFKTGTDYGSFIDKARSATEAFKFEHLVPSTTKIRMASGYVHR